MRHLLVSRLWPFFNDDHTIQVTGSINVLAYMESKCAASIYTGNATSFPFVDSRGSVEAIQLYWFYNSVPNSHRKHYTTF